MNGVRRINGGRKPLANRPEVIRLDYCDEISDEAFAKIRERVKELNDPNHKRISVDGIDWPEDAA